jgi:hypothetical protein
MRTTWWLAVTFVAACGPYGGKGPDEHPTTCRETRAMTSVASALAASDPCKDQLASLWGRVPMVGGASGTLWSRRTMHGTGILVTAAHVATPCGGGGDCPARAWDPETVDGLPAVRLPDMPDGALELSPMFALFNDAVPASQLGAGIGTIEPRRDFSLYVVDPQTWPVSDQHIAPVPDPVHKEPLPLEDPAMLTMEDPSHRGAAAGELVVLLGYPLSGPTAGALTFSLARVLDDEQAHAAIARLQAAGDEEGSIPYDPAVELLVAGPQGIAAAGMSGGGAFGKDGLYLGVMVRASSATSGEQIVRVVRMSHILARLEATLSVMEPAARAEVREFLETP